MVKSTGDFSNSVKELRQEGKSISEITKALYPTF